MPFIVITKRPRVGGRKPFLFHRAVATLEEARVHAHSQASERGGVMVPPDSGNASMSSWFWRVDHPDGTVVEIEQGTYTALVERMEKVHRHLPWRPQDTAYLIAQASNGDEWAQGKILDAFNAREQAHAV